jgi:pimeloyl-ACP methyl ester carboxylesterase
MPDGRKARHLRGLGHTVTAPLMSSRGWALADHVAVLHALIDADPDLQWLVGSSLGALAVAVAASQRTDRDLRLVLLAPAVGVHDAWAERMGPAVMARWAEVGTVQYPHQGLDRVVELPYALHTQCEAAAQVVCNHPTAIVHGLQDEVIPVQNALALATRSPGVRQMTAVADTHRLLHALAEIERSIDVVMRDTA